MRRIPLPVWGFALLLALLTSLPYIAGALNTPQGWVYSGAPGLPAGARVDYNSHLAKMWQGLRGQWDYHLLFTHETHPGIPLLQGFYIGLGALAALAPFGLVAVYHIARFLLTLAMVIALWVFASRNFEKRSERWLALLLATLAGGWSWLLLAVPGQTANVSPIEFWLLDGFNLLGALTMPHFAAAVILQIVVVLSFESWLKKGRKSSLLVLTLALLAEAIVQPYIVLLFGPLLAIWSAYQVFVLKSVRLRRALWLILPLGLHAMVILYHFSAINADPIWSDFSAQNQTLSPPLIFYLLGYLPLLVPALLGLRHLWQAERHWRLLLLWLLLAALLLYFPLPTQRRYLLGLQTPLALLAAFGWTRVVLPRLRAGYRPLLSAVYVLLASVSLIGVLLASIAVVQNPAESGLYASPDEALAYAWLRREANPQDLVLSTFNHNGEGSGGRIVAATGERVYAGHWIETAFLPEKERLLQRFYDAATTDTWRWRFLKDIGAVYLWYDEYARTLGDWDPAAASYLQPVFSTDSLSIYRVRLPS